MDLEELHKKHTWLYGMEELTAEDVARVTAAINFSLIKHSGTVRNPQRLTADDFEILPFRLPYPQQIQVWVKSKTSLQEEIFDASKILIKSGVTFCNDLSNLAAKKP